MIDELDEIAKEIGRLAEELKRLLEAQNGLESDSTPQSHEAD